MLVVEQYLNIRLLLKQCPFCLEYLSEKKNKKGENAQKVKKNPASITYHPFFAFAEMLMPFPMFLLADLLWLSTPVWLGVECFKRWNKVFHGLKLLVPSNETFSFKALKL